jgi:type VI secretion system secreted protein Hcp
MMKQSPENQSQGRRQSWPWVAGLALVYLLPFFSLSGAIDIFLKLNGIEGESVDKIHAKEIDVLSWSWGASNSGTTHIGGGGGAGTVNVQDMSLTKYVDKASPALLLKTMNGGHIPDGTLTVRKAGSTPAAYLQYDFEEIMVTALSTGGSGGEDRLTENVVLNFDKVTETYFITDLTGATRGNNTAYWTVSTNTGGGSYNPGTSNTNTAPSLSAIAGTSTPEDTAKEVAFTISDGETVAGALTLTRGSDNQALVPTGNIVFGGSGTSRTATITPAADVSGSATITFIVTDAGGLTATRTFLFTVNPVNDAPTITTVSGQTTNLDVPVEVNVTVADVDSNIDTVTLAATSAPAGILASGTDLTGSGAVRTYRLTTVAGASGTTTVTLTASDGTGSSQATFLLTVNGPASPLSITLNTNGASLPVAMPENTATDTTLGTLDAVDGSGITHTFALLDNAGGRFKIGGLNGDQLLVADGALINYEAGATYTVLIEATDSANPARSRSEAFTINLSNVNEAPVISPPAQTTVPPETDRNLTGISITDVDPGAGVASFVVTFSVAHGTLALDATGSLNGKITGNNSASLTVTAPLNDIEGVLAATGLRYHGDVGYLGTETLTISADDQGASGSGSPQTTVIYPTFQVAHTPFTLWQSIHFNSAERGNAAIGGPNGEGDQDGVPNLVEYGLGTAPRDTGSSVHGLVEPMTLTLEGETYLAIRFPRRISDPNLVIVVEVATDLTNWQSAEGTTIEEGVTPVDTDFEQVTIRSTVPMGTQGNQQMRLRLVLGDTL